MKYTSVSNPVWYDAAHTMITVDVVFEALGESAVKFVASPNDGEEHGREIYADIVTGKCGPIAEHVTG